MSKKELVFLQTIDDLLQSDLNIKSSLDVMAKMKGLPKKVSKASVEIRSDLEAGSLLSNAMGNCTSLKFKESQIAFVESAQRSGKLGDTFSFLRCREEKCSARNEKIFGMCVYPVIVILMAFIGGIVLSVYAPSLVPDFSRNFDYDLYHRNVIAACVKANLLLCIFGLTLVLIARKNAFEYQRLDVASALKFLAEAGTDMDSSLHMAFLVAGKNQYLKESVLDAMLQMENGEPLPSVMDMFGGNAKSFFEIALVSGNLKTAFSSLVISMEKKLQKTESLFISLMEPVTICFVGAYILILLKDVAMPVLFNTGFF